MGFIKKHGTLFLILILACLLRVYALDWDQNYHLHPDERMLIIVADRIHFFNKLNPEFFNYGSLPVYILKGIGQIHDTFREPIISTYEHLLFPGRIISTIADLATIIGIYGIASLLFKKSKIPIYAAFLYAIAFFPIQNSHFFVVDVFLTCFTTYFLYFLLRYISDLRLKHLLISAIVFAALITTKITAIIFYIPFLVILVLLHRQKLFVLVQRLVIFHLFVFLFSFIFMPYLYLDFQIFFTDIKMQMRMGRDPYVFPYTLQYVQTTAYWYFIKNIIMWGIGPIISLLAAIGIWNVIRLRIRNYELKIKLKELSSYKLQVTVIFFYLFYFLVVGISEVKFMRYMLPIYPGILILAGYGLHVISTYYKEQKMPINRILKGIFLASALIWTGMFINIYSSPHTRIEASQWVLEHISPGSTIAIEHWDDRIPLDFSERYQLQELTIYDQPDNESKWRLLASKLETSDYLIIASNRLYTPLQRLTDCSKYKSCYPLTDQYYKKLFKGEDLSTLIPSQSSLRFKKVAEFSNYPHVTLPIINYELRINDDSADESFTVYDHPKIMIFKRI